MNTQIYGGKLYGTAKMRKMRWQSERISKKMSTLQLHDRRGNRRIFSNKGSK